MYLLELGINGALAGLMYSLVAMGIVLIYKSSSVPNLAQGALTMVGAYVVLAFADGVGAADVGRHPAGDRLTMFGVGMGIERVALRRLAGRPIVMILMMTLGLDIFLRAGSMTIWGGSGAAAAHRHQRRPAVPGPAAAQPRLRGRRRGRAGRCSASSCCSSAPAAAWCCAPSPTTTWPPGRWASRSSAAWRCPGRCRRWWPPPPACCGARSRASTSRCRCCCSRASRWRCSAAWTAWAAPSWPASLLGVIEAWPPAILDPLLGGGTRELVVALVLILTIMIRPHGLFGRHDIERSVAMFFRRRASATPTTPPTGRCFRSRSTAGSSARCWRWRCGAPLHRQLAGALAAT